MSDRVVAGILTYNRPEGLRRCVASLAAQRRPPDQVLVWDNGQPGSAARALADWTAPFPLTIIESQANLGATGGYHALVTTILEDPRADFAYLCDDDTVLEEGNLAALMEAFERTADPQLAAVQGLRPDKGPRAAQGGAPFRTKSTGWVGTLYRVSILRQVGPPLRDLFFCYGEWEWSVRMRAAGYHLMFQPRAQFYPEMRDKTVRQKSFRDSYDRIAFYKMRNLVYLGAHVPHMRPRAGIGRRFETWWRLLLLSPNPLRTHRLLVSAARHGLEGRLGFVDIEQLLEMRPGLDLGPQEAPRSLS